MKVMQHIYEREFDSKTIWSFCCLLARVTWLINNVKRKKIPGQFPLQ